LFKPNDQWQALISHPQDWIPASAGMTDERAGLLNLTPMSFRGNDEEQPKRIEQVSRQSLYTLASLDGQPQVDRSRAKACRMW
ncbi:MAG: hypothetical protein AB1664_18845, partial [Thermodesulfobacteriota bacterium]